MKVLSRAESGRTIMTEGFSGLPLIFQNKREAISINATWP